MPTECVRSANLYRRHHFKLAQIDMPGIGPPPRGTMGAKDVSDLQLRAKQPPRTSPGSLSERTAMQGFERFKRAHRVPDRFGSDFGVLGSGRQFGMPE